MTKILFILFLERYSNIAVHYYILPVTYTALNMTTG